MAYEHRWSGWPGAYCLDCGGEHWLELALGCADCYVPDPALNAHQQTITFCRDHEPYDCPCPGSKRHEPQQEDHRP